MTRILDLDRAISAYDQRCVPIALARFLVIFGVLFALAGTWPPVNINFVLTGLGLFLFGIPILISFLLPRARWIAVAGGAITVMIALAYLVITVLNLLPQGQIIPMVPMDAQFNHALAIANSRYSLLPWMIARIVTALLGTLLAIELLAAGWYWVRLTQAEYHLLIEQPHGLGALGLKWLFDLPPGYIRYLKGALWWLFITMFGMFFFLLSANNIAGASIWHNFWANVLIVDCVDATGPIVNHIDQAGVVAAIGMTALGAVSLFLWPVIGSLLIRLARHCSAQNAANRLAGDQRAPILFLRAFCDDQVDLQASKFTPMRFALSPTPRIKLALDYLLLEEFMDLGPPLALGDPDEKEKGKFPPFGAVRKYIKHDSSEIPPEQWKWKKEVLCHAKTAQRIILVFDNGLTKDTGIAWELTHLSTNPDLRAKIIFIAHPDFGRALEKDETREAILQRNRQIWERAGLLAGFTVPETAKPLLSVSFNADGTITAATASRFSITALLLALRTAFS